MGWRVWEVKEEWYSPEWREARCRIKRSLSMLRREFFHLEIWKIF